MVVVLGSRRLSSFFHAERHSTALPRSSAWDAALGSCGTSGGGDQCSCAQPFQPAIPSSGDGMKSSLNDATGRVDDMTTCIDSQASAA